MELSNSYENFLNLSLIKKELKTELDTSQNTASSLHEHDFPALVKGYSYVKEEIEIEWDENHNNHDEGNKVLCQNDDEISRLDNENICGLTINAFDQSNDYQDANKLKTKTFLKRKCKEYIFDKFCINCKKASTNIVDNCSTCHNSMSFACKICHEQFNSLPEIINHLHTRCNKLSYYQCSSCHYKSPMKDRVIRHIKQIHPWNRSICEDKVSWKKVCHDTEKKSLYKCSKCEKMFGDYKKLNDHYQCCTQSMPTHRSKNKVAQEFSNSKVDNKDSVRKMTVLYCEQCKVESQVEDFKLNSQNFCFNCGSGLMFKCVKCKKQYEFYSSILYHLKRVCNSQKTLHCSECDYTAPLMALINKHYRMTHDRQISFCSTCGGKYKNPESLRKHLYKCIRTTYYECDECDYKTKIKSRFNSHIAKHVKNHKKLIKKRSNE